MKLFEKEKELIFKITNAILLIWFVGAIVFTAGNTINLVLKEPFPSFEEFKASSYPYMKTDSLISEEDLELQAKSMYDQQYTYQDFYKKRDLLISVANVVIVGGALFVINKEPKEKAEKK